MHSQPGVLAQDQAQRSIPHARLVGAGVRCLAHTVQLIPQHPLQVLQMHAIPLHRCFTGRCLRLDLDQASPLPKFASLRHNRAFGSPQNQPPLSEARGMCTPFLRVYCNGERSAVGPAHGSLGRRALARLAPQPRPGLPLATHPPSRLVVIAGRDRWNRGLDCPSTPCPRPRPAGRSAAGRQ